MPRSIDVVIPVYNKKEQISACIASILAQTGVETHVICVDDGSSDGSGPLLDAWAKKEPAVTVCHKGNGGVSKARNTGLMQVERDWFTFCDADDVLLPGALEKMISLAESTGSDIVAGCIEKETASGNNVYDGGTEATYTGREEILRLGLRSQFDGCVAKIYKTERLSTVRFDEDLRINEDGLYVLRALMECDKVTVTDFPVYRYRYDHASASHGAFSLKYRDVLTAGERKKRFAEAAGYPRLGAAIEARHRLMYLNKMASCTSGYTEAELNEARRMVLDTESALNIENSKERIRLLLIKYCFAAYLKIMQRNNGAPASGAGTPNGGA